MSIFDCYLVDDDGQYLLDDDGLQLIDDSCESIDAAIRSIMESGLNIGISLAMFRPSIDPGTSYDPKAEYLFEVEGWDGYSHEIAAQGGYISASVALKSRQEDVDWWLEEGLGKTLVVYNEAQQIIWEGLVNKITTAIGPLKVERGPLLGSVANRLWVSYTPILDDSVYPPITGTDTVTTIAEDDDSQAIYGVLERIVSGGKVNTTLAEQTRDTILDDSAWPITTGGIPIGSTGGDVSVSLECVGFVEFLKNYYYDDTTTGTETLSTKIQNVLGADVNGLFSTDYGEIGTNAAIISSSETDDRRALDIIEDVVSRGDASYNPWTFGIYAGAKAYYSAIPTSAEYVHVLGETDMSVQQAANGAEVFPWNVLPAKYVFLQNHLAGRVASSLPIDEDPRYIFIESVTYTAPFQVNINGVRISSLPQYLAQLGAGQL